MECHNYCDHHINSTILVFCPIIDTEIAERQRKIPAITVQVTGQGQIQ